MPNSYYEEIIHSNPDIPFILHLDNPGKDPMLPNWHSDFEFLYCIDGEGKVRYEDEEFDFKKGEIFVIESKMLHAPYAITRNFRYYCLIPDRNFHHENGLKTENIHFPRIIKDDELNKLYSDLADKFFNAVSYREAKIKNAVLSLLIMLYEKYSISGSDKVENSKILRSERIKSVITYLKKNYAEKITLDDIASYSNTSKHYLSREFKEITGQSIFECLNLIRCKEAKRLIKNGRSVSDAALSCGFDNLSYFSKTYKKITGELPSVYKK